VNDRLQARAAELAITLALIAREHAPVALASSLGAEDMVLTDAVLRHDLDIAIFTLDTGRLPAETLALLDAIERRYRYRVEVVRPQPEAVSEFVATHGADAFYDSVALRKQCCAIRKVAPLRRALAGKRAWITGLRRAQSVTRRDLAERELDPAHGIPKFNPLAAWSEAATVWPGSIWRFSTVPSMGERMAAFARFVRSTPSRASASDICAFTLASPASARLNVASTESRSWSDGTLPPVSSLTRLTLSSSLVASRTVACASSNFAWASASAASDC